MPNGNDSGNSADTQASQQAAEEPQSNQKIQPKADVVEPEGQSQSSTQQQQPSAQPQQLKQPQNQQQQAEEKQQTAAPEIKDVKAEESPFNYKGPNRFEFIENNKSAILKLVGIVIILSILFIAYKEMSGKQQITPVSSTTIAPALFSISGCTVISHPGTYNLAKSIFTSTSKGSCIEINSSNVALKGNGFLITGNGPFVSSPPYSYGINVNSASNVSITGLIISKFSYGLFLNNTSDSSVNNVTTYNTTVSGIYLYNSSDNILYGDKSSSASGNEGGVGLSRSNNNTINHLSSEYNPYYGIRISNSTGNGLDNSTLLGNAADLSCSVSGGLRSYNKFANSSCFVNDGCNFAYCSQINNQANTSSIVLQHDINTCGSINAPGAYSISEDLNMLSEVNTSLGSGATMPCIIINSSNVRLNCNGNSIMNAPYGVLSDKAYNVTLTSCNFSHDNYAVLINNTVKFELSKINANHNGYGLFISNSTYGNATQINTSHNNVGIFMNKSTYITLYRFSAYGNNYGISVGNVSTVYINGGSAQSNSGEDFYCSTQSYNSTLITFVNTGCTTTDCNWATTCPVKKLPNISLYPISSCSRITVPGTYELVGNILSNGNCFDITANNVSVNCNEHAIISALGNGIGFSVENASNVAILGCAIDGFHKGIEALDSKYVILNNENLSGVSEGISLSNSISDVVSNDVVMDFTGYGFLLNSTNSSALNSDHATGTRFGSGFILENSFNDNITGNLENFAQYGFYMNNSRYNTIYNNTASNNQQVDYYCSSNSGGINDQKVMVNTGLTKQNCNPIVVVPPASASETQCTLIDSPDYVTLTQDMFFNSTGTCFNIYSSNSTSNADGTTINCQGHTVFTKTGTSFVNSWNTSGVTVKNCVISGFKNAVVFNMSSHASIINDTIANSYNAIYMHNSNYSDIEKDNIVNSTTGISLNLANSDMLSYDNISETRYGVKINNYTEISLMQNNVSGSSAGLYCSNPIFINFGASKDLGGNMCSTNVGCAWVTSSPLCKS